MEPRPTYIHIPLPHGATKLDRFYTTPETQRNKLRIEIMPVAFTDHYVVEMRITVHYTDVHRARGRWKLDPILIRDEHLKKKDKLSG
jgi:hypothetical protein